MATYNVGTDLSFVAAIDLANYQYYFVKAGSVAGEVSLGNAVGGSVLGVLQNDPGAGQEATVRVGGTSKVYANAGTSGSTIVNGGLVKAGSDGMAWGYNSPTASVFAAGVALETLASGSGVYIEILVTPYLRPGA